MDIECSPKVNTTSLVPLIEISKRLVEGLQVDVIFPHSTYLNNVKAELKKVLKQRYLSSLIHLIIIKLFSLQ